MLSSYRSFPKNPVRKNERKSKDFIAKFSCIFFQKCYNFFYLRKQRKPRMLAQRFAFLPIFIGNKPTGEGEEP